MSFSSTTSAWPFLLGAEDGTVPFGRALRNREPTIDDDEEEEAGTASCSFITRSFLACESVTNEANTTKRIISAKVLTRAMETTVPGIKYIAETEQ